MSTSVGTVTRSIAGADASLDDDAALSGNDINGDSSWDAVPHKRIDRRPF